LRRRVMTRHVKMTTARIIVLLVGNFASKGDGQGPSRRGWPRQKARHTD